MEQKFNKRKVLQILCNYGLLLALCVIIIIVSINNKNFLTFKNLLNILRQVAPAGIMALGVACVIVAGHMDLSISSTVTMAGVVCVSYIKYKNADVLGMVLALVVGLAIGLINGLIIAYLNVTPFITTLGTMIIVYGINSLYYDFVGASPISGFDSGFSTFAQGFVALGSFRLSYITFYALIAVAFVWVLWNKTRFGKNIFAIGGNPEAAKVSGVNVGLNLLMIYALSGVFYAFGGMLEAGRIGSATNNLGFMYELDAIAACVVGGVSFSGGVGTVIGVVTGVIIFTVINYGLTYIGVNPYWQYIIKGAIIIFAVALDSLKYARKK